MICTPLLGFALFQSASSDLAAVDSPGEKPGFVDARQLAPEPFSTDHLVPRVQEAPSLGKDADPRVTSDHAGKDVLPAPDYLSSPAKARRFTKTFATAPRIQRQSDIEVLSKMPVLVPDDRITFHLQIVEPDPNIDYAMIVKRLDLAPPEPE